MIVFPKFRFFYKDLKDKTFTLLDVGAGNHSPSLTKRVFPHCIYHGIDIGNYNNTVNDVSLMDRYFEMDISQLRFDEVPDNFYDIIVMNHIIEHIRNGDKAIEGLSNKLKPGGFIYIEYPGMKSLHLPTMRGTLNFYDDPTHVRVYSVGEIELVLVNKNFKILTKGTRRYWPYIILMPAKIMYNLIRKGHTPAGIFWDLLGFAEYVYAQKR